MLQVMQGMKQAIKDIIAEELSTSPVLLGLPLLDLYEVTGVNEENLTINIKRLNINESYDEVEMLGLGLGNGKGQIKLPNANDIVLALFLPGSETPIVLGTLFDIYSTEKDARIDVKINEYFVNNKINGSYIHIDENNDIVIKSPSGAKIRLKDNGEFTLFNKDDYGIQSNGSNIEIFGNLTLHGTFNNLEANGNTDVAEFHQHGISNVDVDSTDSLGPGTW